MDSYGRSREVEKVKPFNERAEACMFALGRIREAIGFIMGDCQVTRVLLRAEDLIAEAKSRGVKGKDPGQ